MRVLFITHYTDLYGANLSMINLIKDLRERYDVEPTIIVPSYGGRLIEILNKENIKYIVFKYFWWEKGLNEKKGIREILKNIYYFFMVYWVLRHEKFDIIHSNASVIHLGQFLAKRFRAKHVWHLREYGKEDYDLDYYYPTTFVRRTYTKADCCIAISKSIEDYYKQKFPKIKTEIIYNGVDNYKDAEEKLVGATINFCCVGLIIEKKGQFDIIKAANILKKHHNNFKIYLIGQAPEHYKALLKKYIEENELSNYIEFMGHRSDVNDILTQMHVGIMSSKREAFGRVTIEYMQNKMAVIGTNSGATPEIVEEGKSGLLYEYNNIEELAAKMQFYIENKWKILEFGAEGYKIAKDKFNLEQNTDKIYQLYKRLINRK